jgi:hypothetical protein
MTTKLTASQVVEIRRSNEPCMKLAERFSSGVETVRRATRGQTWAHVAEVARLWPG